MSSPPALMPAWEVRYKASGIKDVPLNSKDVQDYIGADQRAFLEPVQQVGGLPTVANQRFAVCLSGTDTPNRLRWHFFIGGTQAGQVTWVTALQSDDGLIDYTSLNAVKLGLKSGSNDLDLSAGLMAAISYRSSEPVSQGGQTRWLRTSPRLMLLARTETTDNHLACVDFELRPDGTPLVMPQTWSAPATQTLTLTTQSSAGAPPALIGAPGAIGSLLGFTKAAGSPSLFDGADGYLHAYFTAKETNLLSVAQYNTYVARNRLELQWQDTGDPPKTGDYTLTSLFPGLSYSKAAIGLEPTHLSYLRRAVLQNGPSAGTAYQETFAALPPDLGSFLAVLSGEASDDTIDPDVLAGERPFYDYDGLYQLYLKENTDSKGALGMTHRFGTVLGKAPGSGVPSVARGTVSLSKSGGDVSLTATAPLESDVTLVETWTIPGGASLSASTLRAILNGTSPSFDYAGAAAGGKISLTERMAVYQTRLEDGLFWIVVHAPQGWGYAIDAMQLTVEDGDTPSTCCFTVRGTTATGEQTSASFNNISRVSGGFVSAVQAGFTTGPLAEATLYFACSSRAGAESATITNFSLDAARQPQGGSVLVLATTYGVDGAPGNDPLRAFDPSPHRTANDALTKLLATRGGLPRRSALFQPTLLDAPDTGNPAAPAVQEKSATLPAITTGWRTEPARNSLKTTTEGLLPTSTTNLSALDTTRALTMESWVRFQQGPTAPCWAVFRAGSGHSYTMIVSAWADRDWTPMLVGQYDELSAAAPMPPGTDLTAWNHMAATYKSGHVVCLGSSMNSKRYIECDAQLSLAGDMTVTGSFRMPFAMRAEGMTLMGQWGKLVSGRSWRVALKAHKVVFEVVDTDRRTYAIESRSAVDDGTWHRLTAVLAQGSYPYQGPVFDGAKYVRYPSDATSLFNPPLAGPTTLSCWFLPYELKASQVL
ncbi:MAG: hypothetical protein R3F14_46455, partial [Polyangiaceae bacterium]